MFTICRSRRLEINLININVGTETTVSWRRGTCSFLEVSVVTHALLFEQVSCVPWMTSEFENDGIVTNWKLLPWISASNIVLLGKLSLSWSRYFTPYMEPEAYLQFSYWIPTILSRVQWIQSTSSHCNSFRSILILLSAFWIDFYRCNVSVWRLANIVILVLVKNIHSVLKVLFIQLCPISCRLKYSLKCHVP
jgi:hypothetical protein